MTITEFLDQLRTSGEAWELDDDGPIRRADFFGELIGRGGGDELDDRAMLRLWATADNERGSPSFDPLLRAALLDACCLEENTP